MSKRNEEAPMTAPAWTQDELARKIEEAIHLAAKLGPDAFDAIEGRGLLFLRLDIAAAVAAGAEDSKRLDWLLDAVMQDGTKYPCTRPAIDTAMTPSQGPGER